MMIVAAFVSYFGIWFLLQHLSAQTMRRLMAHKGLLDLTIHSTILYLFWGTSTMGLLQAEAAGLMLSVYIRWYRFAYGYITVDDDGVLTDHSGFFRKASHAMQTDSQNSG